MQDLPNPAQNLVTIGKASKLFGVSIDTIRRWDAAGKIKVIRTPGGTRLIPLSEVQRVRQKETEQPLSIGQAAKALGVSVQTLRRWDKKGLIGSIRTAGGSRQFSPESIHKLKTEKPKKAPLKPVEKPALPTAVPPQPIQIVAPAVQPTPPTSLPTPTQAVDISTYKIHQKVIHHIKNTRPGWYRTYHKKGWASTVHTVVMVLFAVTVGALFLYSEVIQPSLEQTKDQLSQNLGDVLAAATPPRILSFQGRLTDDNDVPVSSATNIVFRIWNHPTNSTEVACDGGGDEDCMWKSKTWVVTPDQNGIFSVQLGDTSQSDTAIPSTLFSEEAALYLGVKVESDSEMTPRQRIASVSYALNSDSLDGVDSLSFLRSDTSDMFSGGTLTLTFAGTQNLATTSDLAGSVNVISLIGTPSGSTGTAQGLLIQQADSANSNGLDAAVVINNADTNLAITDAILITNTGGGGTPYTNLFNSPTLDISGAGAITGATGFTSSGTITFSSFITDANAVLYTTTGGVVTRVVETETGSQCLLSGAGVSGIPSWGACSGGSVTLDAVQAAAGAATRDHNANTITWQWDFTAADTGLTIGEASASTGGAGNQFLLDISTFGVASTAAPLRVTNNSADSADIVFNLAQAGDMVIQDAGTPFAIFYDTGRTEFDYQSGQTYAVNINTNELASNRGFDITMNVTGDIGAFTGQLQRIDSYREHSPSFPGTLTDTGNILELNRTSRVNDAGSTYNVQGAMLEITNTTTPTAGTLNDTAPLAKITQDADATGELIHLVTNRSGTNTALRIEQTDGGTDIFTITDDGGLTVNLQGGSDFVVQDAGSPFVTFTNTGTITVDGATTFNTDVDMTFSGTENLDISNTAQGAADLVSIAPTWTADNSADGLSITTTYNVSASTSSIYALNITNANNGASTGVIDALALFSNDQATETLTDGIIIRHNASSGTLTDALQIENTTAGGTITNAINILETAGTISTALNIGNNIATGISIGTGVTTAFTASSGDIITSNLGINITDSDTNPGCAAGEYKIYADTSETKLKKCQNGTASDLDTTGGGGDPDTAYFNDPTDDLAVTYTSAVDLWDGTQPNITPAGSSQTVLVAVVIQAENDDNNDGNSAFQVRRNIGADATCSSTQVGIEFQGGWETTTGDNEGASAVFLDSPATTSEVRYTVCTGTIGEDDGNVTDVSVSLVVLGADLAENYYTNDDSIVAGHLVSVDASLPAGAKKTTSIYDGQVLGVVSTAPGKVLDDAIGLGLGRAIPVALVGRVPVKINGENGPINVGDLITSSSALGVGMKSTKAGYVIGRAMTSFSGEGEGTVLAFVSTHYANPEKLIELDLPSSTESAQLATGSALLLTLDSGNNLSAAIFSGAKFVWTNSVGQVVAWVTDMGEAFFQKVTAAVGDFQKLVFGELVASKESQVAGQASFEPDETEVFIKSDKVTEDSLIYITATTKTAGLTLYIKEQKPFEGFTVALERSIGGQPGEATASAKQAIKFNWLIINRE